MWRGCGIPSRWRYAMSILARLYVQMLDEAASVETQLALHAGGFDSGRVPLRGVKPEARMP